MPAANSRFLRQTTEPRYSERGRRRSKVPLGPHLFMMAIKNSNQMNTHKKCKDLGRDGKPPSSTVLGQDSQSRDPSFLGAQIHSALVSGVGTGGKRA